MFDLNNLDSIQIGLASPEQIRSWSYGEVTKPETINYRTLKPERDGLFCERIFGPTKDWECNCGKYKRVRNKGTICDKCGVEVTRAKVRRERMGHIELAAPVSHIWYFKGIPSRIGTLLELTPRALEHVLYFASYIVMDPGKSGLIKMQVISDREYREALEKYPPIDGEPQFRVGMGAEAIKELLMEIDLEALSSDLRSEIRQLTERETNRETEGQKLQKAIKRLEVVEAFRNSGQKPEWMILDVIPVIPPELRSMVQLDGGRFATSDLNDLYRRIINRNNRLKRLLELGAPDIIVRNEKRMLQEAVDALIDNGRRGRAVTGPGNRPLKSLSEMLRGKQGRFRQNLLGKRVDYSGRSVIVIGPTLKMYQCGLPKEMALELFKPFVMQKLVEKELVHNIKSAKRAVERVRPEVWDVLEEVIREHPVMLNRAPTLHRLGIQAFEPILVEGKALKLHPLMCTAFNADFDGDQMAVHVPLSMEAQAEARFLMLSANNILKPQDGKPVVIPTQDMILGCYYLTQITEAETDPDENGVRQVKTFNLKTGKYDRNEDGSIATHPMKIYTDEKEALMAYQTGNLQLGEEALIRMTRVVDGVEHVRMKKTTIGRIIFNERVPQDMGMVPRKTVDDMFEHEVNKVVDKKMLGKIVDACYRAHGVTRTVTMLDSVKAMGYAYSTKGALTVSVADVVVPAEKKVIMRQAEQDVLNIEKQYKRGRLSNNERYQAVITVWDKATTDITKAVMDSMDEFNPISMMANSGARGSTNQIRQLSGMRGLMASPSGAIIELPIKANFREGLTVLEFFLSSHGSRKALADTALKTADSGYMTRRLVDVSQDVIVREVDCFETRGERVRGLKVNTITDGQGVLEELEERLTGRCAAEDVKDPATGEIIVSTNELITKDLAQRICAAGIEEVTIRTVLTCRSEIGVCARCYGANLTNGKLVDVGEAVGIIAAQSIGEPGTQLTMRTFHSGGVAAGEDITQGLPRVEELFEARRPKREAVLAEVSGVASVLETKKKREVTIRTSEGEARTYPINYGAKLKITDGQNVEAGMPLTDGAQNPQDVLRILGVHAVQDYQLREVQRTYRSQAVAVADKHIEVIVRQMMRKVKVQDAGDTGLLPGSMVDMFKFERENEAAIMAGGRPAMARRVLLGITKASLATDSFLSAASFQETTRVLTEAAIKGKIDPLLGLKENVIVGKLIPAGTGLKHYSGIGLKEVDE